MTVAFKTTGTATYRVREITPDQAAFFGCPGSDFALESGHGFSIIGTFTATGSVPGREVRVPGWTAARRGIRALFVPAVLDDTVGSVPVDGYLALT